ncbi:hypothetical protein KAU43_07135 [candidate division WOR-3 bacterium]|jgi:hypothetical protein|nr:hypothetical protein [candidate division WOR-3 bacterium]
MKGNGKGKYNNLLVEYQLFNMYYINTYTYILKEGYKLSVYLNTKRR